MNLLSWWFILLIFSIILFVVAFILFEVLSSDTVYWVWAIFGVAVLLFLISILLYYVCYCRVEVECIKECVTVDGVKTCEKVCTPVSVPVSSLGKYEREEIISEVTPKRVIKESIVVPEGSSKRIIKESIVVPEVSKKIIKTETLVPCEGTEVRAIRTPVKNFTECN